MGKLFEETGVWYVVLLPIGFAAVIWGLPALTDIFGWFFQGMRDFATAVKG